MKKQTDIKHLVCVAVTAATVFSLGCLAMADEVDGDGEDAAQQNETAVIVEDVEETVTDVVTDADIPENGWYQDYNNYWYYYVDGSRQYGWLEIGGKWYCFDSNNSGRMMLGLQKDSEYDAYFLFGPKGDIQKGWQEYNNRWYYFYNSGKAATDWTQIDGKWYYFNPNGEPYMYTGICNIDGEYYCFGKNGASLAKAWYKTQSYGSTYYYYFKNNGKAASGWQKIDGKYYYFDTSGQHPMRTGVIYDNETNAYYGLGSDGAMITSSWYNTYTYEYEGKTVYGGDWYYFGKDGKAFTDWQQIGGEWYYFDINSSSRASRGLRKIDGKWYFFDTETCAMFNGGWKQVSYYYGDTPQWAYFKKNGAAYTGWQKISGKWYYFYKGNYSNDYPYMKTGIFTDSETEKGYYLGDDGVMKTGWIKISGTYMYANSKGELARGWQTIGGKDYYFDYYYMTTGYKTINGTMYYFGTDGVCRNAPKG
ncbi:N-acetylmuramoyl-L-alanine amidase family protein [Butyrivibrio sp. AE2032]|uniref:N-acetylmuramoyl-L-alanine amidase family protein n=1 Tax=Butyrivibrio sp. AE2032 TaxID=1458463 RepID=UPI000554E5FF|nr:N-acetylmuramoyl-L-alanine amidase family protein [Butyrivibrio sp. AE2032]